MSFSAMQSVVSQIQSQAAQLAEPSRRAPDAAASGVPTFGDALASSLQQLNHLQVDAKQQSQRFMLGDAGVELNDVMISGQKAVMALTFGIQMRNKMVSAYQEIMNMAV